MTEVLTFDSYSPAEHTLSDLYLIGATEEHPKGVAQEMAETFGVELAPPSASREEITAGFASLRDEVGKSKNLQQNIASVQEKLGTDSDAIGITRDWITRSGLMTPVDRKYITGQSTSGQPFQALILPDQVYNWSVRMGEKAVELSKNHSVGKVVLAGSDVGVNVPIGPRMVKMLSSQYVETIHKPWLRDDRGLNDVETVLVSSTVGDEVMDATAEYLADQVDLKTANIGVVSVAGAWMQRAGQFRRAVRKIYPDFDQVGAQLSAHVKEFPLGHGTEPLTAAQNPIAGSGNIPRALEELSLHVQER